MKNVSKLKSEYINNKLITFTKEQSLVRTPKGERFWTVPTVRAFYRGKEIGHTSYSNPKQYLIATLRGRI